MRTNDQADQFALAWMLHREAEFDQDPSHYCSPGRCSGDIVHRIRDAVLWGENRSGRVTHATPTGRRTPIFSRPAGERPAAAPPPPHSEFRCDCTVIKRPHMLWDHWVPE